MEKLIKDLSILLVSVAIVCVSSGTTAFASVVLTGSMEPEINVGDIVLAHGSFFHTLEVNKGDVIIYKLANSTMDIPIVHRVIRTTMSQEGTQLIMTKGDANDVDDKLIWRQYGQTRNWIEAREIRSIVYAKIPLVGMPLVWLENIFGNKWRWMLLTYILGDTLKDWFIAKLKLI